MRFFLLPLLAVLALVSPAFAQATDALDEVNAARQRAGLRPFVRDDGLAVAALSAARYRASRLIAGHVNDFEHLPAGCSASAAGCAAWEPSLGWGSCTTYESYTHAGAAYAIGKDGRRFMHIFVRNGPQTSSAASSVTVTHRTTTTEGVSVEANTGRQRLFGGRLLGRLRGGCR
jgi:hypothetical protein